MCEEEKEKPDWLSDLQNNQKHKERENIENSLDLNSPVLVYASPRYGRRSVPGTKSVENSPTKTSSSENKSNSTRSNSARPLRVRDELVSKIKKTDSAFTRSLEILRDDFEKLSLHGLPQEGPQQHRNSSSERLSENWEDSWNSIETFNFTQEKGARPLKNVFHEKQFNEIIKGSGERNKERTKVHKATLGKKQPESTQQNFWNPGRAQGTQTQQKSSQEFIIPELPQGQNLVINIKTTWGDKHFLGLNGIEIFNSKGIKPQIRSISGKSDNSNCTKNIKCIENLIDNVYLTQDDMHMWMAPYTPNSNHFIHIEFDKMEELALLRIWNYNKSRIHCNRGVKDLEIKLDNKFIFIGEIAMASGEILDTLNSFGDTILFTTDEGILELVAENDEYFNSNAFCTLEDSLSIEEKRPLTGGNMNFSKKPQQAMLKNQFKYSEGNIGDTEKKVDSIVQTCLPILTEEKDGSEKNREIIFKTGEVNNGARKLRHHLEMDQCFGDEVPSLLNNLEIVAEKMKEVKMWENDSIFGKSEFFDETGTLYIPSASELTSDSVYETLSMPTGFSFTIQIHSTWGDLYYVGLNGVQVYDEHGVEIKLRPDNVRADPEGVNILEGMENDARTPDKLIDGVYETMDGCHMWLAPVLPLTINRIEFIFQRPVTLSSMKLWNYSKTPGRGVREFGILVDGLLIYNGELNQAPVIGPDGLPKIPCKTINFSNSERRKSNEDFVKPQKIETSIGTMHLVDQSKRPLTTMTSQS